MALLLKLRVLSLAMGVLDSSYIKALGVKSAGLKKYFWFFMTPYCSCQKARCQILCSMRLQYVSKILTPCRMLKKSLTIAKINRWNNIFQNMYV